MSTKLIEILNSIKTVDNSVEAILSLNDHIDEILALTQPRRFFPGLAVITVKGEQDEDEHNIVRHVKPGTLGWLDHESQPGMWSLHFPNGCVVLPEEHELADPDQYVLGNEGDGAMAEWVRA